MIILLVITLNVNRYTKPPKKGINELISKQLITYKTFLLLKKVFTMLYTFR